MRTACAYIRVSDERQDEYSPESQRKRILAYAAQHNIRLLPDDFFYDDGISAKKARNRSAFQQMIARAKTNPRPFDVILVWKFSRFARNQEESIVYKNLLRKIGVEVLSVSEPITDDPFGSLIERIIEWMDEYYLINLSSEVRRGMQEKATRGEAMGRAVFGYDRTAKSYVPNSDAPRVAALFEAFANGASPQQLANTLCAEGVRTVRGNLPTARWVTYLLQNPIYTGQIRWCTAGRYSCANNATAVLTVRGQHEAIVSQELFERVQCRFSNASVRVKRRNQTAWMLQGLLYCSACGGLLVRAGAKPPSVQCARYAKRQCSQSHALSLTMANRAIINALTPILHHLRLATATGTDTEKWEKRLKYEELRLRRVREAYCAGVDTLAEYRAAKKEIESTIEMCESHLRAHSTANPPEQTLLSILTDENADASVQNTLLQALCQKIVYQKETRSLWIYLQDCVGSGKP